MFAFFVAHQIPHFSGPPKCNPAASLLRRYFARSRQTADAVSLHRITSDYAAVFDAGFLIRFGLIPPSVCAAARHCNSMLAASSFGSCGTSSPRKALVSSVGVRRSAAVWAVARQASRRSTQAKRPKLKMHKVMRPNGNQVLIDLRWPLAGRVDLR